MLIMKCNSKTLPAPKPCPIESHTTHSRTNAARRAKAQIKIYMLKTFLSSLHSEIDITLKWT